MNLRLQYIIISIFFIGSVKSQELKCNVRVTYPQIAGTSVQVYKTMQKDLYEFMNSTKWTKNVFDNNERIECAIVINISSKSGNKFVSTLQVQSNRPIYGTSYQSPLMNLKEDDDMFDFEYIENQNIEYSENRHSSNLLSVLAYYAYIIIGMDYDSFSSEGGTEYFQKAQRIVNNAQSSTNKGWKAFEAKKQDNRYFLVENLLNRRYSSIRRGMYRYHRLGLDRMADRLEAGRTEIAESLRYLQRVFRTNKNLYLTKVILDSKSNEIVDVFSGSFAAEKTKVFNIMKEIDQIHLSKYEKMIKTK